MTIAIAIVGGLAIILQIFSIWIIRRSLEGPTGYGVAGGLVSLGYALELLIGYCFFVISYLLTIALYVLALISGGGITIAIIGALTLLLSLFLSIIAAICVTPYPLIFSTTTVIALFVLALVK